MKTITFYRVREPYGEFSNFSPHPIELKGRTWPTSEHYFQAQKFAGTEYEETIRLAAMKQTQRDARIRWMKDRALPFDDVDVIGWRVG